MKLNKPVYIPTIEASDIYNYMYRDRDIDIKYLGMIPSSLELNKMLSVGLKTFKRKPNEKLLSNDVVNVKFKQKILKRTDLIKKLETKIKQLKENQDEYKISLQNAIDKISNDEDEGAWRGLSANELRKELYENGFIYKNEKYVVYKRSSAKSRIGQCLFIKEKLMKPMKKWSRLGIEFDNRNDIDFPSLLAYESLVSSSLEGTVRIDPENILLVDDVNVEFEQICNVIRTGSNGYLDSFEELAKVKNSLFDGESLLDSSYFEDGKSMILLRNHMFKSAAFNCNIQHFLKDNCPSDIRYDEWILENMFGQKMLAKQVKLITTPSSLKALKFSGIVGSEKDMWNYWKKIIKKEQSIFGIVKSEKRSKHSHFESQETLQQTSYQMINSLPINQNEMTKLLDYEKEYIEKLKNNDEFFIQHILKSANSVNSNEMFHDLYRTNHAISRTELFRSFRAKEVVNHVNHLRKGKIRLKGDYMVMIGNPMEFLCHAIGKLDLSKPYLKDNEVYTKSFDYKELTGFRNPHTSPSNVLIAKNTYVKELDQYFNLSDNVICVNAINFPLQDILSSCDYDSDTVLIIDSNELLQVSKKVYGNFKVCLNGLESSKKQYSVNQKDMALIDNELSKSQRYIGQTVNLGQLCMSNFWDVSNSVVSNKDLMNDLIKKVDVVTVLSCVCIDLAKKMYSINIGDEIDQIKQLEVLSQEKPLFWKFVSQNNNVKMKFHNCPMDVLSKIVDKIKKAKHKVNVCLSDLIVQKGKEKADHKQLNKIVEYVEKMNFKIKSSYKEIESDTERDIYIDDIVKYYSYFISKYKISEKTMSTLITQISTNHSRHIASRLLKVLHSSDKEVFKNVFSA